jgi:hypothetical protein
MTAQAAAVPGADLVAWAIAHGPSHLRYAAERDHVTTGAVLDAIAKMLADALGGRVMVPNDELIQWRDRKAPSTESLRRRVHATAGLRLWKAACELPDAVKLEMTEVLRVEEQTRVMDPSSVLKYSGLIVAIAYPGSGKRFVLVNLEAGTSR